MLYFLELNKCRQWRFDQLNEFQKIWFNYKLQFEEEQFDTIPDLILFYQTHRKPITRSSGCLIINPVPNTVILHNETEPQREIEENYMRVLRPQFIKGWYHTLGTMW